MTIEILHLVRVLKDEPITLEWINWLDGSAVRTIVMDEADALLFQELRNNPDWAVARDGFAETLIGLENQCAKERAEHEMARGGWRHKNEQLAQQILVLKQALDDVARENLELKAQLVRAIQGRLTY